MTESHKKFLKSIKKVEIKNQISDLRFFLRMAVEHGSQSWKDLIVDGYANLKTMFKNRNNYGVLNNAR